MKNTECIIVGGKGNIKWENIKISIQRLAMEAIEEIRKNITDMMKRWK